MRRRGGAGCQSGRGPPTGERRDQAVDASALVLLTVPGLALFFGGMVRRKNILTTRMHSLVAMAIIGVPWALFGYALAFGTLHGGLIGWSWDSVGLQGIPPRRLTAAGSPAPPRSPRAP